MSSRSASRRTAARAAAIALRATAGGPYWCQVGERGSRMPAGLTELTNKPTNKQRILVNVSISKNSMALGTRPLERVPNNVS